VKGYKTPSQLSASILKDRIEDVCRRAHDLGMPPNAFVNECVAAITSMMDAPTPLLPEIVAQYRVLAAAGALRSDLKPTPLLDTTTSSRLNEDPALYGKKSRDKPPGPP
jgi:hypothetical protein